MNTSRVLITGVAVTALVAGCAAAARLGALRPPAIASASALARANAVPSAHSVRTPARQLGIDVDFYTYPTLDVARGAKADVAYVKKLHGNAMSVSFPFFMNGPHVPPVHRSAATPSPAEVGVLASYAEHAGLYFSFRPLLDEKSLDFKGGRTHWTPSNPAKWFASYEKFLRPYAQMAQRDHVPEIITGVEFDHFNNSRYWPKLDAYLRTVYHGTLAYSNNWEIPIASRVNRAGVVQLIDAYKPMRLSASASVATLTRSWDAYLGSDARGIVLSELGIAAQEGSYRKPFDFVWNGKPLAPAIQVRWITAACNAVASRPDDGLYLWSIGMAQQFNVPPGPSDPASFVDGPGAKAIASCFKRLG